MGCNATKQKDARSSGDKRPIALRYAELNLNQPFSTDTENNMEKEIFYAINMLRYNPKSFV